jgi:peptide/nickel transport system permease protein
VSVRPRAIGGSVLLLVAAAAALAPWLAPNAPADQFGGYLSAPPSRLHVVDDRGGWHRPFIYPSSVIDRLSSRYAEDRSRRVAIRWLTDGRLVSTDAREAPLLPLGADRLGRDVWSRLLFGARLSLGVALLGTLGALLVGVLVGGVAGYAGGLVDEVAMQVSDFVLILPAVYVLLALRAVMPLVLDPGELFALVALLLALVGWPMAARGVRAIVAAEGRQEYAVAARSLGAGHLRVLFRHLLPAARGYLAVQATLLVPAFILAEATLSYVGLGFTEPTPSWGTMLEQAGRNVRDLAVFPWLLSPAVAIVVVALAVHVATAGWTDAQLMSRFRAGRSFSSRPN